MTPGSPPLVQLDVLVGREREVQLLLDAHKRVKQATCEAVLVHGESGSGKTALVRRCFQRQHDDGTMISGKFDVLARNQRPYSAIVDALAQLCQTTSWNKIVNDAEFQAKVRERLSSSDIKILSKFVPDIERQFANVGLTSAAEDKPSSGNSQDHQPSNSNTVFAFARFAEIVRAFLFLVAGSTSSPLILFLDDIQAADAESQSLISSFSSVHSDSYNLLLILAYRDNEGPCDVVQQMTGLRVTDVKISNLDLENVNKVVSKILRMDPDETMSLSQLVSQRTGGHVYSCVQFLEVLRNDHLLKYSFNSCNWEWNLEQIRADTNVTENVAQLLTLRIQQLPSDVQLLLKLAACLGFYFDIVILQKMVIQESNITTDTSKDRTCATGGQVNTNTDNGGLLLSLQAPAPPLTNFGQAVELAINENLIDHIGGNKYRFAHDRVLQSVYEMIPEGDERDVLHWRIGQMLWAERRLMQEQVQSGESVALDDWLLFAATDQLNLGTDFGLRTTKSVTPLDLARLNLEAGKAALEKSAFKHAAKYFDKGVTQVKESWQTEYSLCLELHMLSAEADYASSKTEKCDQTVSDILSNGLCLEDKVKAYLLKVQLKGVRGKVVEAMDEAAMALRLLGENIPKRPNTFQVLLEITKTKRLLKKMTMSDLASLPDMTDTMKMWAIKFLQIICMFSWYAGLNLSIVVSVCRMVQLTVKHGISSSAPYVVATYGVVLGFLGELDEAYQFGRAAMELTSRPHTILCYANTVTAVFGCLDHLKQPLARIFDHSMEGYNAGIKSGEIEGATSCLGVYTVVGIFLGKDLRIVAEEMDSFHQAYHNEIDNNFIVTCMQPYYQLALNLTGRSVNPLILTGDVMSEETYLIKIQKNGIVVARSTFLISKLMISYILGDVECAAKQVNSLVPKVDFAGTHFATPFTIMYASLVMLAMVRKTRKRKYARQAVFLKKMLHKFLKGGNLNIPPLMALVSAEQASLRRGCPAADVKKAYETAIRMAAQSGFSVLAAIGNEKAAEYMQRNGDSFWTETYLSRALPLYEEWGATVKARQMREDYSFLAKSEYNLSGKSTSVSLRKRYTFKESNEKQRLSTV